MTETEFWVRPRTAPGFRLLFVLTLVSGAGVCSAVLPRAVYEASEKANRTKCSSNLRQLGIAAIQYAEDKRFFPHVRRITKSDEGYDSSHSAQKTRLLLYYGYHDNPEGFVCPDSEDVAPLPSNPPPEGGAWTAVRTRAPTSPFEDGGSGDPTLRRTSELSYGWTRKGANSNCRSTVLLMSDRAVYQGALAERAEDDIQPGEIGNHVGGLNMAYADGSVQWSDSGEDAELPWGADSLDVLPGTLRTPRRERPLRRSWRTVAAFALPTGYVALLGWMLYMGWRRRVPWSKEAGLAPRRRRHRWETADVIAPVGARTLGPGAGRREGRPQVTLAAGLRCPYCHASLAARDDLLVCAGCRTPQHRECVQEGGVCSTLGCAR